MERIKDRADSWHVDNIGNLIVFSKGTGLGKKIMLAAHMDEVGLLITGINDNGLIKFKTVGGIEPRVLVGKRVRIGKDRVPGVIGYKPVHLQDSSERKNAVKKSGLTIDIGAKDREQAERAWRGDTAALIMIRWNSGTINDGKALDNRVGCVMLAELLGGRYPLIFTAASRSRKRSALKGKSGILRC